MPRPCQILRVFTRGATGGNHLGVVNDFVDLDEETMQRIATDLGFSETVFIDWQPGDHPFVRIFTPAVELPFAGHPLVGSAWVMTRLAPGSVERLRCGIGEVAIRLEDDITWIEASLGQPVTEVDPGAIVAAGLPVPLETWQVDMPLEYQIAIYPDAAAIAALVPNMEILAEHFGTLAVARDGRRARARFFAPDAGVAEDPATGSAAVALAAVLVAKGEESGNLSIHQGEEVGMPSRIELAWTADSAAIGGTVVRDEVRMID